MLPSLRNLVPAALLLTATGALAEFTLARGGRFGPGDRGRPPEAQKPEEQLRTLTGPSSQSRPRCSSCGRRRRSGRCTRPSSSARTITRSGPRNASTCPPGHAARRPDARVAGSLRYAGPSRTGHGAPGQGATLDARGVLREVSREHRRGEPPAAGALQISQLVYADWTASGRLYGPIERRLSEEFGPLVGNTHSESSTTGMAMTRAYQRAQGLLKAHIHATGRRDHHPGLGDDRGGERAAQQDAGAAATRADLRRSASSRTIFGPSCS